MTRATPMAALALSLTIAACAVPEQRSTPGLLAGSSAQLLSDAPVSAPTQRAARAFERTREPFGAMYVTTDGTGWGWITGFSTLAEARRAAEIFCEAGEGQACRPHMVLVPEGAAGQTGLSPAHGDLLREALSGTEPGRFAAVAVSGIGAAGAGWDSDTRDEATGPALAECQAATAAERAEAEPAVRRAYDAAGILDCRVLRVYQP